MPEGYSPITIKHDFKSLRKKLNIGIVFNVVHTRKFFQN